MASTFSRVVCSLCGREVSARLDGTPWAHRPPVGVAAVAVPGGNCKGGYR